MTWHLGFSIVSGVYFIYTLFHKVGEHEVDNCIARHSKDSNKEEECRKEVHYLRGAAIALYIVFWLFQLCASLFFLHLPALPTLFLVWLFTHGYAGGCLIAADYVSQLKEEDGPAYPPPAEIAATAPPLATTYNYRNQYSFSAPENSFGQNNASNV